jgi:CRP/FNR family transcriptional regulator
MIDPASFARFPLFSRLNAAARRELSVRASIRRFSRGSTLFSAGMESRGLFLVLDGRVRVVRHAGGRRRLVHVEEAGGTLGEVPLFSGGGYPATAIAMAPTRCVVVSRDALEAALHADPSLAWSLLERLAARVRALVDRLDALQSLEVTARLASYILARRDAARREQFPLGATQAEVAEDIGTVREVLVRSLRALRRAGTIQRAGRGAIRIIDLSGLRRLARGEG